MGFSDENLTVVCRRCNVVVVVVVNVSHFPLKNHRVPISRSSLHNALLGQVCSNKGTRPILKGNNLELLNFLVFLEIFFTETIWLVKTYPGTVDASLFKS